MCLVPLTQRVGSFVATEAVAAAEVLKGFPSGSKVKNLPAKQETWEMQVRLLAQEDSLEQEWQPTPVFLFGEPHGQRSLVGYSL